MLGLIEPVVCILKHFFMRTQLERGTQSQTERDLELWVNRAPLVMFHCTSHPFAHLERLINSGVGHYQRKLFTSVAGHKIPRSSVFAVQDRNLLEDFISGSVSESDVDPLEKIYVRQ